MNILLYGIVCALFLKFFTLLFDKMDNRSHETSWLSIMSALLFTLHPLHAENVLDLFGVLNFVGYDYPPNYSLRYQPLLEELI